MKYFIFTIKSKIRLIPILFIILLIFMGSFYIVSNDIKNTKISLEIYFEEKESKNALITNLIKGTQSTKNNIVLTISYDIEDSFEKLDNSEIDVLIKVPLGFYESILNGENKSAKIYFSKTSPAIAKGVFKALSESSAIILSCAQSNIYISDNISDENMSKRNLEMNRYFINCALNREDNFKFEIIKNEMNLAYIYIIMLIMSIAIISLRAKSYFSFYSYLKVRRKNIFAINLIEILSNSIIFFLFSIILLHFLKPEFKNDLFINLCKAFLISFFVSAFIEMIFAIFKTFCIFVLLMICILAILNIGLILPRSVTAFASISPMNLIISNTLISWAIVLIYTMICICITNYMIRRNFK